MNAEKFREITKGHFFTVVFTKKDGTERTLNGLDRVKSYLKGGKPVTDGRVVVWDRKAFRDNLKAGKNRFEAGSRSYRSFWPDQIIELRVGKKVYKQEDLK